MKKIIKRVLAVFLITALITGMMIGITAVADESTEALGSLGDSYQATLNGASFTLSTSSRFFIVSDSEPTGELLQTVQLVQRQFAADKKPSSNTLEIVWGEESWAKAGDIVVKLDTKSGLAAEAYQLNVAEKATVTAVDADGLLYGLNMLHKYFRADGDNKLSGFTASDAPDTKERTVMLDCARKYYTKDWICNFIREMSWMGYNTLELHFSEDGGFRADFWDPEYYTENYQPENDFTWLCGSHVQSWVNDPYRDDPDAGSYLTTAELIEIIETAKEYHLDVIPSFDSPAHMDYITWKFEQNYLSNTSYSFTYNNKPYKASATKGCINYLGATGYSIPKWPYYTTIDITDGTMAKAFVFALYEDIADFFKEYAGSTDFSIGADEVSFSSDYSGYKWNYSKFPGYVNDLDDLLKEKGYTVRIFNDFIGTTSYTATESFNSDIEILYWISPFDPNQGYEKLDDTKSVSYFVKEGRTLYNCIQTNCYYALRIADGISSSSSNYMKDARDPSNTNWTFYHSTEEDIYNEWYPADISEHGLCSEDVADVPESQLGGGYFLIWNDYAALNTEIEVWNGVTDGSNYYSLIDRMWSNITKMWNWDINDSVTFADFEEVRDEFGYFPGYKSCSVTTTLPTATTPTQAYLADHTELANAIAYKIESGLYTDESYAAYEAEYEKAVALNADHGATAEAMAKQVEELKEKENGLVFEKATVTIQRLAYNNGTTTELEPLIAEIYDFDYEIYVEPLNGYRYMKVEGAKYEALPSGDGSGYIIGNAKNSLTVTIWYENVPDNSRLNSLIRNAIASQGSYTDASWRAYMTALTNAKNFSVSSNTKQADIDALVKALEEAESNLVIALGEDETTEIISIQKLTETTVVGKMVGLKIVTTADVETLTIDGVTMDLCIGKVQTLNTGETVKIWLIDFAAEKAGEYTYTVKGSYTADGELKTVEETVDVTIK